MKLKFMAREIIKQKGLKQRAIAENIGISEQKLCDILNGRKKVDVAIIGDLCGALDVSPNQLLGYK